MAPTSLVRFASEKSWIETLVPTVVVTLAVVAPGFTEMPEMQSSWQPVGSQAVAPTATTAAASSAPAVRRRRRTERRTDRRTGRAVAGVVCMPSLSGDGPGIA